MSKADPAYPRRRPELLCEMEDQFALAFGQQGKTPTEAAADAKVAIGVITGVFGGQQLYIPLATLQRADEIAGRIRDEFNGTNYDELASKYAMSAIHVRRILKRQRPNGRSGKRE